MTTKAIVTKRGTGINSRSFSAKSIETLADGLVVEKNLDQGTLVKGEENQLATLESQGYRVKILKDTNILEVGTFRVDTEQTAEMDSVSTRSMEAEWTHYLVQLSGPREDLWIREIEKTGVEVVESISAFGLFVVGDPEEVAFIKTLPFVEWVGMFKPEYRIAADLKGVQGIVKVNIGVYPESKSGLVQEAVLSVGGKVIRIQEPRSTNKENYAVFDAEIDAEKIEVIAGHPDVRWIEQQLEPVLEDERSAQILAENLNGIAAPNTSPNLGYQNTLNNLGVDGTGVVVAICDSGVDTHINGTMHPDLQNRMAFFEDVTAGGVLSDVNGHGTHVAGIAVGNATTGDADPQGFLLGLGVAPGAQFGSVNAISGAAVTGTADWFQRASANGANVINNSWGAGVGVGYTADAREMDQLVRDPNTTTTEPDQLVVVFSAGNSGSGASTITSPKEAKNVIVVGNSMNFRPGEQLHWSSTNDDIRGINQTSSRGPALDGRILPTVVAPGSDIISARSNADTNAGMAGVQRPRTAYQDTNSILHPDYTPMTGTSMAAPHVAGACALLIEWWRNRTGGKTPSQALLKALLINGAEDLAGGPDGSGGVLTNIPNNIQGWGRVSLENMILQAPGSDRGPKIFVDQRHAFTNNGQEFNIRVAAVDNGRPLRITLVWTDAAGAANASPALVNDLDLEVTENNSGSVFKGNFFSSGFSVPGGAFDSLNNMECVYVQNPTGIYDISVIASSISASARADIATPWQDFAMVIDNAQAPSASPVSVVPVIDRSGSMIAYGYVNTTVTSSKQFVDLLNVDDRIGIVSFGDTASVDYSSGALVQTITDTGVKDAAKSEIDDITFGGCTFMGDGLDQAQNLLSFGATDSKAIVLLSDGYDNKGCDMGNPLKPSALSAIGDFPGDLPIYSCAMGPSSDQALLQQLATDTDGRYFYMPTIDDLFEIYNYIRGNITGDSIIANESAMASSSRVGAFVDAQATEVTFTVSWAESGLRFVHHEPKKKDEIRVQLRDPKGRVIHMFDTYVRKIGGEKGDGYVAFVISDPMPGRWYMEVSTNRQEHTRYTACGFVKSPIKMNIFTSAQRLKAGSPVNMAIQMLNGKKQLTNSFKTIVGISQPLFSMADLLKKYRDQLVDIKPDKMMVADGVPADVSKMFELRNLYLKEKNEDLFGQKTSRSSLRNVTYKELKELNFKKLIPPRAKPDDFSGIFAGQFKNTQTAGSYNMVISADGMDGRSRYFRKQMVSVFIK